jgi:hypothetical protein
MPNPFDKGFSTCGEYRADDRKWGHLPSGAREARVQRRSRTGLRSLASSQRHRGEAVAIYFGYVTYPSGRVRLVLARAVVPQPIRDPRPLDRGRNDPPHPNIGARRF